MPTSTKGVIYVGIIFGDPEKGNFEGILSGFFGGQSTKTQQSPKKGWLDSIIENSSYGNGSQQNSRNTSQQSSNRSLLGGLMDAENKAVGGPALGRGARPYENVTSAIDSFIPNNTHLVDDATGYSGTRDQIIKKATAQGARPDEIQKLRKRLADKYRDLPN